MAATRRLRSFLARLAGLLGGVLAVGGAKAVDLPENRAEGMLHVYNGGGVTAAGPAFLVRKNVAERVSLSGSYYVDAVSNASIDVVTTASKFKETRHQVDLGVDYAVRDSLITLGVNTSREPDYKANGASLDVSQEMFGGMTTVALGYTRALDKVGRKNEGFFDHAKHWQYRLGVTQILTPKWLASANFEAVSDEGYLGSPYRAARVFGALVPERNPRTRSSRAIMLRAVGDLGDRQAMHADYRYYWDNWKIKAHTIELGYSRYFGPQWLADAKVRFYRQGAALFYSDDATAETTYVSRNRQLSTFNSLGLGAKLSYLYKQVPGQYEVKLNGSFDFIRYKFSDFTDLRTGAAYGYDASVLQLFVTATF